MGIAPTSVAETYGLPQGFRPMLAVSLKGEDPPPGAYTITPKIDGIRCILPPRGPALSRRLLPIPNQSVQERLQAYRDALAEAYGRPVIVDGEVVVGDPWAKDCMQVTEAGVMSAHGSPDFHLYVFDALDPFFRGAPTPRAIPLNAGRVVRMGGTDFSAAEMASGEWQALVQGHMGTGYEGAILRAHGSPYKFGRSTLKEGYLLKVKPFEDAEAEVLGVIEQEHNGNTAEVNALGLTKRSSAQAGKTGRGRMGALRVRMLNGRFKGVVTRVGNFSDDQRVEFWAHPPLGRVCVIRYMETGAKDKPRHPTFHAWRNPMDLPD